MTSVQDFINYFHLQFDKRKSTAEISCLRSSLETEEQAEQFIQIFSALTNTKWVLDDAQPRSQKFLFHKTWICHLSWKRKVKALMNRNSCSAKIEIIHEQSDGALNGNNSSIENELSCIINMRLKHSHDDDDKVAAYFGVPEETKKVFFNHFDSGLNVRKSKEKYEEFLMINNTIKNSKPRFTLTHRQVQHLYNQWLCVKDHSEPNKETKIDNVITVTVKEMLSLIPKADYLTETQTTSPQTLMKSLTPNNQPVQPSLVFVSTECTASSSDVTNSPVLYKLRHGVDGEFATDRTEPQIKSIQVDSPNRMAANFLHASDTFSPLVPEVLLKEEPFDSDEESDVPQSPVSARNGTNSVVPVTIKAFSCENDKTNNVLTTNVISSNKDAVSGKCLFPLVFTLNCTTTEGGQNILLYTLKQGLEREYVTSSTMPQVFSVHVNSSSQATLKVKDESSLQRETSLDVHVEVEQIKTEPEEEPFPNVTSGVNQNAMMPKILNVVSWSNEVTAKNSSELLAGKPPIYQQATAQKRVGSPSPAQACPAKVTKLDGPPDLTHDEDYKFLMSILPDLKNMQPDQKARAKMRIRDVMKASRLLSGTVDRTDHSKTNIYRDCRSLPILSGWKF